MEEMKSSRSLKKYLFITLAITVAGIFLSLASTAFFANKIIHQLSDVKIDQPDVRNQQVKELSSNLHYVNISVSNPFFFLATLAATTPGSYGSISQATNGADHFLSAISHQLNSTDANNSDLAHVVPAVSTAMPELNKAINALANLHVGGLFSPMDKHLNTLREQAKDAHRASEAITPILKILPNVVGMQGTRRYLVAFQNPAEARGTGGIFGAYAILTVNKGVYKFTSFGSNSDVNQLKAANVPMPEEFTKLYNDDPGIWSNSNLSAHFPYGAVIWLALWRDQFNQQLDGVLTLDPATLGSVLAATGPILIDGQEITAENVVRITLSDLYKEYENNQPARKAFLVKIIAAVTKKLEQKQFSIIDFVKSVIQPLNQHRILFFSRFPAEERIISSSPISGVVSNKVDNQYRLVIQNISGNKMDYYLKRNLTLKSLSCSPKVKTKVIVKLTNTATKDMKLPNYVKGRLDLKLPEGKENSNGTRFILLAPVGTNLVKVLDQQTGKKIGYFVRERGHKGVAVDLELKAEESQTFEFTFSGGTGKLSSYVQPLVIDQKNTIIDTCKP